MNTRVRAALLFPATLAIAAALIPGQVQAGSPEPATTEPVTTTTVAETTTTTSTVAPEVSTTVPDTSPTVPPTTAAVGDPNELQGETAVDASATSDAPTTAPEAAAADDTAGSIGGKVFNDRNNDGVLNNYELAWNIAVDVVCGDVTVRAEVDGYGDYLAEALPLGDCTVTVDTSSMGEFGNYLTPTADPDGGLDGTSKVTLTAEAPAQLDQTFGYRALPYADLTLSTNGVTDTVADGKVSVGDTIQFEISVLVTDPLDVTTSDTKLGLADASCTYILPTPEYFSECLITTFYVITAEDVAAGGVEVSATARVVDPATGDVVTDRSDTRSDPDGKWIANSNQVETDNPLKVNANDPADPTDDPTTLLIPKTTDTEVNPPTTAANRPSTTPVTGSSGALIGLAALLLVAAGFGLRMVASRTAGRSA